MARWKIKDTTIIYAGRVLLAPESHLEDTEVEFSSTLNSELIPTVSGIPITGDNFNHTSSFSLFVVSDHSSFYAAMKAKQEEAAFAIANATGEVQIMVDNKQGSPLKLAYPAALTGVSHRFSLTPGSSAAIRLTSQWDLEFIEAAVTASFSGGSGGGTSSGGGSSGSSGSDIPSQQVIDFLKKIFAPLSHVDEDDRHVSPEDRKRWDSMVAKDENTSEVGTAELTAHVLYFAAPRVPVGTLRSLTIRCRNTNQSYLVGEPGIYLALWERVSDGDSEDCWTKLGESTAPVAQKIGTTSTWNFDSIALHGRELRVAPLQNPGDPFNPNSNMVIGGLGFATDDGSMSDSIAFLPQYSFAYDVTQFAPLSHLEDTSLHFTREEKDFLQTLMNTGMTPGGGTLGDATSNWKWVFLSDASLLPPENERKNGTVYCAP